MKLDERIRRHADELRTAYAHRIPEPPKLRRRPRAALVAAAAALVTIAVIAPVAFLDRSQDQPAPDAAAPDRAPEPTTTLTPPTTLTPTATESPTPPLTDPPLVARAELGDPLLRLDNGGSPGTITDTGQAFVVVATETAYVSEDDGGTWTETAPLPINDVMVSLDGINRTLLAIGSSHDGMTGRLYVSPDLGDTWVLTQLPVPAEIVHTVATRIAVIGDEFFVAGWVTDADLAADLRVYLWRSGDGVSWTGEQVADRGGNDGARVDDIVSVDGALIMLARSSSGLLAFEKDADQWVTIDVQAVVDAETGIAPDMTNADLAGSEVVGRDLLVWWRFNNEFEEGGSVAGALARRSADVGWEATRLKGPTPETVAPFNGGYVGVASLETFSAAPSTSSLILVSEDGLQWEEIARLEGVDLSQLLPRDEHEYLAVGHKTERVAGETKRTATAVWPLTVPDPGVGDGGVYAGLGTQITQVGELSLVIQGSNIGFCLEVRTEGGMAGGCGTDFDEPLSVGVGGIMEATFAHGWAPLGTAEIEMTFASGEIVYVTAFEAVEGYDVAFFLAPLPSSLGREPSLPLQAVAYDAQRNTLATTSYTD